jgi:hypothetical protein
MRFPRGVLAAAILTGSLARPSGASAQPSADLVEGRQLFVEALADEEHGRFAAALEKYQRVQAIRDTVNVRYRIGAALDGLGRIARAVEAYNAAITLGVDKGTDAEVVRAAQGRLDVLRPRIAHLLIHVSAPPGLAPHVEVQVDSAPVATQALGDVAVDPGPHVVTASGPGARPFRAQITLSEGGRAEVPIALEPEVVSPPPLPSAAPPAAASSGSAATYRTVGVVTSVAGGVLLVGGAVVLLLRSGAISKLHDDCPGGSCPASKQQDLTSTRDRALAFGPLGGVLLAAGALALGTGIVLFTVAGRDTTTATRIVPSTTADGAMLNLLRTF